MNYSKRINNYGKWSLVTGASDGIGRDFARELASIGQNLILISTTSSKLEKVQQEIEKRHKVSVEIYPIDLSKEENIQKILDQLDLGRIGFAVLSAGYGSLGEFSTLDMRRELDMIDLNCKSVVHTSHQLLNHFKKRPSGGGLVLFGSLVGFQGAPWSAVYSATKSFIQSFAEAIRVENKKHKIDILCVAPGPVNSGFGERASMKMGKAQSPKGIAKKSLKSLGKYTTVRPGFLSKFLGYSLIILPRSMRVFLLNFIMGGMRSEK